MPTRQLDPHGRRRLLPDRPKPPMWLQWTLSLGIAAILVIALIVFVNAKSPGAAQPIINKSAIAEENREATILVGQDQAPHVVALPARSSAKAGLTAAVSAFMNHELSHAIISGTLQSDSCAVAPGGTPARVVFHCTAMAANVNYPFDGVVYPAKRQIVYCKRDLPPVPSMNIPVSSRCT